VGQGIPHFYRTRVHKSCHWTLFYLPTVRPSFNDPSLSALTSGGLETQLVENYVSAVCLDRTVAESHVLFRCAASWNVFFFLGGWGDSVPLSYCSWMHLHSQTIGGEMKSSSSASFFGPSGDCCITRKWVQRSLIGNLL
jgi:hypothetical protein